MSHTDENTPVLRTPSKHSAPIGSCPPSVSARRPLGNMDMNMNASVPLVPPQAPHLPQDNRKLPLPVQLPNPTAAFQTPTATPFANRTRPLLPPPFSRTHSEPLLHHHHQPQYSQPPIPPAAGLTPTMARRKRAPPSRNVHSSSPTDASTVSYPSSSSHSRASVSTSATLFEPEVTPTKMPELLSITNTFGLMSPAPFPGPYPSGFLQCEPCPWTEKELRRMRETNSFKVNESSLNPWDYIVRGGESESPKIRPAPLLDEVAIGGKRKVRRRFSNEELQCLEIVWSISHDHKKYSKQRLGAWIGVPTKHITYWLQNRRQELKKAKIDGLITSDDLSPAGGKGTFDPTTGKIRTVPPSCITAIFPPSPHRTAFLNSVLVGDFTREMYYEAMAPSPTLAGSAGSPVPKLPIKPLPRRAPSANLDDVQKHREDGFGAGIGKRKRQTGGLVLADDSPARNEQLLALMSSDPPSEPDGPDGDEEADHRVPLGRGRPSSSRAIGRVSRPIFGRATSHDLMASSQRARELIAQQGRHATDPIHTRPPPMLQPGIKRRLPPVPTHEDAVNKYAKVSATRSVVRSLSASDASADLPPVGDLLASVAGPSDWFSRHNSLTLPMPARLKEEREQNGQDAEADWAASLLLSFSQGA